MKLKRILKWIAGAIMLAVIVGALALVVAYTRSTNDCESYNTTPSHPIKAITYCDFGDPGVLKFQDIEKPTPADDQLLVKVRAAALNPLDWHYLRGTPYIARIEFGLRKPKKTRLGVDFAGTVEAVGQKVTQFKPGDEVFGQKFGALAEYVCVGADRSVVLKPSNLTFEEAASVPVAAVTALQGLRDQGKVQAGQKVLINGASAGVGTFAVQIAKSFGAEVTGVCSSRNVELVRSLGADHVIDYTKEDFTKGEQRYDVILDNVGNQPLSGFQSALTHDGICVMIGGGTPNDSGLLGPMSRPLKALLLSPFTSQRMGMFMANVTKAELNFLGDLIQTGKLKPVIDKTYPLSETAEAMRYLEAGHARGKVVILCGS